MSLNGIQQYETKTSAYNSESFIEFLRNLVNHLNSIGRTQGVFIMDNVNLHKTTEVRNFMAQSGFELLFLPPYSPFLNPIENMFSKWKNFTKRARPNNEAELMNFIEMGENNITAEDCAGFFRKMNSYIPRAINNEIILD